MYSFLRQEKKREKKAETISAYFREQTFPVPPLAALGGIFFSNKLPQALPVPMSSSSKDVPVGEPVPLGITI